MTNQFGAFTASELHCPKCRKAQPVREKLLLILPTGELHEYLCTGCGSSLGERTVTGGLPHRPATTGPVRPAPSGRSPRGLLR
jgi:hypothetical protein